MRQQRTPKHLRPIKRTAWAIRFRFDLVSFCWRTGTKPAHSNDGNLGGDRLLVDRRVVLSLRGIVRPFRKSLCAGAHRRRNVRRRHSHRWIAFPNRLCEPRGFRAWKISKAIRRVEFPRPKPERKAREVQRTRKRRVSQR